MKIALLIPVYNEEESLPLFYDTLQKFSFPQKENVELHYLFVNDGSQDKTFSLLKKIAQENPLVHVISFSRNFGKEAAITAGLTAAQNYDAVIIMDVDLQDPPSLIPTFIQKWQEGFEMVYAVRTTRASDPWLKRITANYFYKFYNLLADRPMPPHAGDCRLLSRVVVKSLLQLPERERFMKGLFNWVGFKSTSVPSIRQPRQAGNTKWNYWQLWKFSLQGITAGSTLLLRLWTYVGIIIAIIAVLFACWVALKKIIYGNPVNGYASIMVTILFCSGIQLISLGIIGEYLSRIFMEAKQRPLYLIEEKINL